jgi:hypothetical protein
MHRRRRLVMILLFGNTPTFFLIDSAIPFISTEILLLRDCKSNTMSKEFKNMTLIHPTWMIPVVSFNAVNTMGGTHKSMTLQNEFNPQSLVTFSCAGPGNRSTRCWRNNTAHD